MPVPLSPQTMAEVLATASLMEEAMVLVEAAVILVVATATTVEAATAFVEAAVVLMEAAVISVEVPATGRAEVSQSKSCLCYTIRYHQAAASGMVSFTHSRNAGCTGQWHA